MKIAKLTLTEQEANDLLKVMNIAVKAAGLESGVAHFAVRFNDKLQMLFAPEPEVKKEEKKPTKK